MKNIVQLVREHRFTEAEDQIDNAIPLIMEKKLFEMKKAVAAKMCEQMGIKTASQKIRGELTEDELEEQEVASGKMNSSSYNKSQTTYVNDVIKGKPVQSNIGSTLSNDDKTPAERASANDSQRINTALKTPAPRAGGYTDARTNKPYVSPTAEKLPLHGPTTQGSSQSNIAGKSDRVMPSSPVSVNNKQNTTVANKVNEEQLDELSDAAKRKYLDAVHHKSGLFRTQTHSSLQGIKSDSDTIKSQIKRSEDHPGKTSYPTDSLKRVHKSLEAKHERRSAIAKKVAASLEESTEEQLDEVRINIVRARVRGGKVQRRKKVSNVPGMTLRGGTLKRMSAAERRRRKMGARKGKMKRRAKLSRSLMKRKRSLQKRKSLGL